MWRQLGKQLERFLQRGSVPTAKAVAQNNSEAHNALREAVRDLSKGQSLPLTRKPTPVLLDWNSKKVDELETEQLEELARIHFEGDGVNFEKSPSKALSFWEEAAKRGSIDARYSKAVCYRDGVGTKKDVERGFVEMLQLAKDENYHLANYAVAIMYDRGEGIEKNDSEAFNYYKAAARGGVTPALHNIGNAYAFGKGVKQSDKNALLYYQAGAEAGDPASLFTLGTWYFQGKAVQRDKKVAFELQMKAAEAKHPGAMFNIGTAYMAGDGVDQDFTKAAEWYEQAVDVGIVEAAVNLANMYRLGHGVKQDQERALSILEKFRSKNELCQQLYDVIKTEKEQVD